MENKENKNSLPQDIKPVSRPSNEEIDDDIADIIEENPTTSTKKFHRSEDVGQGVED